MQELDDGGVERVGGVLSLRGGGGLETCGSIVLIRVHVRWDDLRLVFEVLARQCGFLRLIPQDRPTGNSRLETLNTVGCRRANIAGIWRAGIRAAMLQIVGVL